MNHSVLGLTVVTAAAIGVAAIIVKLKSRQSQSAIEDERHIQVATVRKDDGRVFEARLVQQFPIKIPSAKELMAEFHGQIGALATFEGITRNTFEGMTVVELEYEGYETMALKQMLEIMEQTSTRFEGVKKIVIIHKLGPCPVGETSLFVAALSAHRGPAMSVIPILVDELKLKVPIWKLEKYADKGASWKENAGWDPSNVISSSQS